VLERYPLAPAIVVHSIYRHAAKPWPDEPDAGNPHVRICRPSRCRPRGSGSGGGHASRRATPRRAAPTN